MVRMVERISLEWMQSKTKECVFVGIFFFKLQILSCLAGYLELSNGKGAGRP